MKSSEKTPFVFAVTGANRGIGLEFARQLALRGDRVIATASSLLKKGVGWRYERRGVRCKEARRRRCGCIGEER